MASLPEYSWACLKCKNVEATSIERCPKCGASSADIFKVVNAGEGTLQKYDILQQYTAELSKIMRFNGYQNYLIDACAGSGIVYDKTSGQLIDGSPLIFAKVMQHPRAQLRNPEGQPETKTMLIEYDQQIYRTLTHTVERFPSVVDKVLGDCNTVLDNVLDKISSTERQENHFAFVYVDPFGLGTPTIGLRTLDRVLKRDFTELLIHFSWEAVTRLTGLAFKHLADEDDRLRKTAISDKATLDGYLGEEWWEIEMKNLSPSLRRRAYTDLYASKLRKFYELTVPPVGIPTWKTNPDYYLFFATRNQSGASIMQRIIGGVMREGAEPLDKFWSG